MFYAPNISPTAFAAMSTDLWQAFMLNPTIILANQATLVEFEIPYVNENDWLDVADLHNGTSDGAIGTIAFVVCCPLSSSATNTSALVTLDVYAAFKDPEVAAPYPKKYVQPTFTPKPKRQLHAATHVRRRTSTLISPHSEANAKTTAGTTAGFSERVKNIASSVTSVPILGPALGILGDLGAAIGLNKPKSLAAPTFVQTDEFRYLSSGKGLSIAAPTSLDPEAQLSDEQSIFGFAKDHSPSVKALAMTPSLLTMLDVSSAEEAGTVLVRIPVGPFPYLESVGADIVSHPTWFSTAARQFAIWQGSTRFHFLFVSSKYLTARFRISWMADDDGNPESDNGGEVYSTIVDVKGDTPIGVTVPWLSNHNALRTPANFPLNADKPNGYLVLSLVNAPVAYDATVEEFISIIVTTAAGPDIQFALPTQTTDVSPQGSLSGLYEGDFPPLVPASYVSPKRISLTDTCDDWKTYMHRVRFLTTATNLPTTSKTMSIYGLAEFDNQPEIFRLMRFMRGSWRLSLLSNNANTPVFIKNVNTYGAFTIDRPDMIGLNIFSSSSSPNYFDNTMHFEIPYDSTAKFYPRSSASGTTQHTFRTIQFTPTTAIQAWLGFAVGDDFSHSGWIPPAGITYSPPPVKFAASASSRPGNL